MANLRYSAIKHYVIVTGLGEAIREELVDTPSGAPDRVCHVVPGEIAWDACECGQLALSSSRLFPSRTFPTSAADDPTIPNCGVSFLIADITISMTRCVPISDEEGNPPTCDALGDSALVMYEDGAAVLNATICFLNEEKDSYRIADWTLGELTYVGPQGECAGVELNVKIAFTGLCCDG